MKNKFKPVLFTVIVITAIAVTSCGTWESEVYMNGKPVKCTAQDVEKRLSNKTNAKQAGTWFCGSIGKKYAGDVRCKDGFLQTKCN